MTLIGRGAQLSIDFDLVAVQYLNTGLRPRIWIRIHIHIHVHIHIHIHAHIHGRDADGEEIAK